MIVEKRKPKNGGIPDGQARSRVLRGRGKHDSVRIQSRCGTTWHNKILMDHIVEVELATMAVHLHDFYQTSPETEIVRDEPCCIFTLYLGLNVVSSAPNTDWGLVHRISVQRFIIADWLAMSLSNLAQSWCW